MKSSTIKLTKHKIKHVNFRDLSSISGFSTDYGTHGIYYFPARFIPHVVRYVLDKYCKDGCIVFDPFAGSGTVGVEASLCKARSILWDLTPLIKVLILAKLAPFDKNYLKILEECILSSMEYPDTFCPDWPNIEDWYPSDLLYILKKAWAYYYNEFPDKLEKFDFQKQKHISSLYAVVLLYLSRRLSYTDDSIPKLYRSKIKKMKINKYLNNPRKIFRSIAKRKIKDIIERIRIMSKFLPKNNHLPNVDAPVDALAPSYWHISWPKKIDIVVTSPPYLTAHEYIRSVKLELYWLKFRHTTIRKLRKYEIPYRNAPNVNINSKLYQKIEKKLCNKRLIYFKNYFNSLFTIFRKIIRRLSPDGILAIFAGNSTLCGLEIPIPLIIVEHLLSLDLKIEEILVDKIKRRKIFKGRNNLNPEGIIDESLIIMRKS